MKAVVMTNRTRLIPVSKWNDFHLYPSVASLRHLIFFEEMNGFSKVLRRIGRRLYIDEESFFEWVKDNSEPSKKIERPSDVHIRRPKTNQPLTGNRGELYDK